jgi:hypothetical protein
MIEPPLSSAQLYNALYDYVQTLDNVVELTVEDPSEAFEDLRDRCDLVRVREQVKDCKEMEVGAPIDRKWLERTRREGKYAKVGISDGWQGFRRNADLFSDLRCSGNSCVLSRCCSCNN